MLIKLVWHFERNRSDASLSILRQNYPFNRIDSNNRIEHKLWLQNKRVQSTSEIVMVVRVQVYAMRFNICENNE